MGLRTNYQNAYPTATTTASFVGFSRSTEFVQVMNNGTDTDVIEIVIQTTNDPTASFASTGKVIQIAAGESFADDIAATGIWYRSTAGSVAMKIYVSW